MSGQQSLLLSNCLWLDVAHPIECKKTSLFKDKYSVPNIFYCIKILIWAVCTEWAETRSAKLGEIAHLDL